MFALTLHRWRYHLLHWSGRADAAPTEFAATVISAERPGYAVGDILAAAPATAAAVSHIGRYVIKGRLGSGGLGEVFEGWDPLLSRAVAVKTLLLHMDPELRALLDDHILNEARAVAGLSHPHIVTVFDAGLCTPGVYIAMERLHGRDLRQALAQGWQPTPWQAAQLARRVAEALAYAHGKGVVHCDIKPANIFLDQEDRPKVLDFGIARMAQGKQLPGSPPCSETTSEPLQFGSPHYLAPEQLQLGVADARTDVHALGVVLYEMLSGRKAFAGDSVAQVVNAVLSNHPAPAHETRAGVPRTLSAIAARAMAREPERRYARAEDMAGELRDWCERQTAAASRVENSTKPSTKAGGKRASAAARPAPGRAWAGVGLLLCMAVVAWLWWLPANKLPALQATAPAVRAVPAPAPAPAPISTDQAQTVAAGPASPAIKAVQASTDAPPAPGAGTGAKKVEIVKRTARAETADPKGSGAVLLSISPWGHVEVDGRVAGTTPPLSRLSLPAGRHTITVRNEDFPTYTTTVMVQADKPALVRHRFVQ